MFNNIPVKLVNEHKHLGIILDKQLSFTSHINSKLSIARGGLGIISRLRKYFPRINLEFIFKTFIRPHLEYGDFIFHQPPRTKEFSFDTQLKPYNTMLHWQLQELGMVLQPIGYMKNLVGNR